MSTNHCPLLIVQYSKVPSARERDPDIIHPSPKEHILHFNIRTNNYYYSNFLISKKKKRKQKKVLSIYTWIPVVKTSIILILIALFTQISAIWRKGEKYFGINMKHSFKDNIYKN